MAYEKIESHDEYLKAVEQYQDYEAGTYQSMTLEEKFIPATLSKSFAESIFVSFVVCA